jgi:argininosuccinate lyase
VTGGALDAAAADAVVAAFAPAAMVAEARGLGGPQPAEIARMLDVARRRLDEDAATLRAAEAALAAADAERDAALRALLAG